LLPSSAVTLNLGAESPSLSTLASPISLTRELGFGEHAF
jgi:hypothetical protein